MLQSKISQGKGMGGMKGTAISYQVAREGPFNEWGDIWAKTWETVREELRRREGSLFQHGWVRVRQWTCWGLRAEKRGWGWGTGNLGPSGPSRGRSFHSEWNEKPLENREEKGVICISTRSLRFSVEQRLQGGTVQARWWLGWYCNSYMWDAEMWQDSDEVPKE